MAETEAENIEEAVIGFSRGLLKFFLFFFINRFSFILLPTTVFPPSSPCISSLPPPIHASSVLEQKGSRLPMDGKEEWHITLRPEKAPPLLYYTTQKSLPKD